tara:strand:- start:636 stop:1085 length:450 start_codon:yes stop_codon:yes gene_type:complete
MKIILLKSHEKLGNPGDILNVKPGFARNYLFPQKIAQLATESNIKSLNSWVEQQEKHEAKNRANIELLSKYLNKLVLKFELESSDDDKLFGSVTSQMISKEIENQGYSVDKKEIILEEPIKNIGNHYVEIDLDFDPKPKIKIKVSAANQ